jgi:hypothetical protein
VRDKSFVAFEWLLKAPGCAGLLPLECLGLVASWVNGYGLFCFCYFRWMGFQALGETIWSERIISAFTGGVMAFVVFSPFYSWPYWLEVIIARRDSVAAKLLFYVFSVFFLSLCCRYLIRVIRFMAAPNQFNNLDYPAGHECASIIYFVIDFLLLAAMIFMMNRRPG